jgi:hypothetical protein
MMNNTEIEKPNALGSEINGYRSDKTIGEQQLSTTKHKVAQKLLNGLGEDIKETLTKPQPLELEIIKSKESKIKKFFKKLINTCS